MKGNIEEDAIELKSVKNLNVLIRVTHTVTGSLTQVTSSITRLYIRWNNLAITLAERLFQGPHNSAHTSLCDSARLGIGVISSPRHIILSSGLSTFNLIQSHVLQLVFLCCRVSSFYQNLRMFSPILSQTYSHPQWTLIRHLIGTGRREEAPTVIHCYLKWCSRRR